MMDIDELDEKFSIEGEVGFAELENEIKVRAKTAEKKGRCTVATPFLILSKKRTYVN